MDNVDKINQISKDLINNGVIKQPEVSNKRYDFGGVQVNKLNSIEEPSTNINNYQSIVDEQNKLIEGNNNINSQNVIKDEIIEDLRQPKVNVTSLEYTENVQIEDVNQEKPSIVYQYIGQVFDTYIIIQIKERMYIIDQHAAHERLLYEQIKEAYYSKDKQTQLLLIPVLVELTTKEMEVVNNNMEMFEKSGFMIEVFGDNAIKISGVPNIGYDIDYKSMFKDIIDELLGANKTQNSEKEFRFLATLACKAAVKGKMKLDQKEQIALIEEMVKLDNPFTCPHGRPTAYEISKYEIERRFLRK